MALELEGLVTEEKFRANELTQFIAYVRDFVNIALVDVAGDPPDAYTLSFNLKGCVPGAEGGVETGKPHTIRINLPEDYPKAPPVVTALTPLHHPAVNPADGGIDVSGLWAASATPSLRKVVNYLARLITGSLYNVPNPANPEALAWYGAHADELPLDTPIRVEEEGTGPEPIVDYDNPYSAQIKSILSLLEHNQFYIAAREMASLPPDLDLVEREEMERRISAGRSAAAPRAKIQPPQPSIKKAGLAAERLEDGDIDQLLGLDKNAPPQAPPKAAKAATKPVPKTEEAPPAPPKPKAPEKKAAPGPPPPQQEPEPAAILFDDAPATAEASKEKPKKRKGFQLPALFKKGKKADSGKTAPETPPPAKSPNAPRQLPKKGILAGAGIAVCVALLAALGFLFMQDQGVIKRVEQGIAQGRTQVQAKRYAEARGTLQRAKGDLKLTLLGFKKAPLVAQIDSLLSAAQKGIAEQKKQEEEERARQESEALSAAAAEQTQESATPEGEATAAGEGEATLAGTETPEDLDGPPENKITPAELLREETRLQEAMDAILPKAKRAFERSAWKEAAALYDETLALAADSLPEVREKMADFLGQVERIRDMARINANLDAANAAAVRKDWTSVVRLKSEAINVIAGSSVAQEEEFATLKKQLQDQINDHKRELAEAERARDLEARGIDYILKNFSNYKKQHLSQPRAKFLRREGSRHVYELRVVDRSQGRPSRLAFHFAYDERTRKWERVRQ